MTKKIGNTLSDNDAEKFEETEENFEIGYIMIGCKIGSFRIAEFLDNKKYLGGPASVDCNGALALKREEEKGDVQGFYHTHPNGFASPSLIDDDTMKSWVICFGKSMLCVIKSGKGKVKGFLYNKKGYCEVRLYRFGKYLIWKE